MKNSISIKLLVVSCFCLLSGISVLAETYEVGSGTITASDEFVFKHTGTKDSFAGTLTRKSDGFTLYFDIGKMAGTHMHDGMKDQCTYFRKHTLGGLPAITGIETIPDGKRIVTTVAYDPKTDRDPANFWVAIHKDTDIADFLLIATTYQVKNPQPHSWPPPLDEKLLIGTWVRKNQPIQGVENQTLLILWEDHS